MNYLERLRSEKKKILNNLQNLSYEHNQEHSIKEYYDELKSLNSQIATLKIKSGNYNQLMSPYYHSGPHIGFDTKEISSENKYKCSLCWKYQCISCGYNHNLSNCPWCEN